MDLLRAVFEFGSRNLNGDFDAEWSAHTYASLASTLRASGVHAATNVDVPDW